MITPFLLQVNNHSNNVRPYSDKAILPANILSEIINDEIELPHPLIFKITNQSDPFVYTYIGVKEFTSEPGEVILPSFVNAKLQNPTDVSLELERNIPKAISLCIKPKLFYANVKNWKFFLEEGAPWVAPVIEEGQKDPQGARGLKIIKGPLMQGPEAPEGHRKQREH